MDGLIGGLLGVLTTCLVIAVVKLNNSNKKLRKLEREVDKIRSNPVGFDLELATMKQLTGEISKRRKFVIIFPQFRFDEDGDAIITSISLESDIPSNATPEILKATYELMSGGKGKFFEDDYDDD